MLESFFLGWEKRGRGVWITFESLRERVNMRRSIFVLEKGKKWRSKCSKNKKKNPPCLLMK